MRVKSFILATSAVGALALSAGASGARPNGPRGGVPAAGVLGRECGGRVILTGMGKSGIV